MTWRNTFITYRLRLLSAPSGIPETVDNGRSRFIEHWSALRRHGRGYTDRGRGLIINVFVFVVFNVHSYKNIVVIFISRRFVHLRNRVASVSLIDLPWRGFMGELRGQSSGVVVRVSHPSKSSEWVIRVSHPSESSEWVIRVSHPSESSEWVIRVSHPSESSEWVIRVSHPSESSEWVIRVSHRAELLRWDLGWVIGYIH